MPSISAVVCTKNSISSIERCLTSLKEANIDELVVVDAHSTDGTTQKAEQLADVVLTDKGKGLGAARNIGIAQTTGDYILNFGSDNVLPPNQLEIMREELEQGDFNGVSAQTTIHGTGYLTFGLNAWRQGRFQPGSATVIGTPTLFRGEQLRENPYGEDRKFSDDSELCERWAKDSGATFAISSAWVWEIGKTTPKEIFIRARMYGVSDYETFQKGNLRNWSTKRQVESVLHPLMHDIVDPLKQLPPATAVGSSPFLVIFAGIRYLSWISSATKGSDS